MDELDREVQDRISRRRMIKRLGAATAVAWTAPVLSTLGGTPAFAQTASPCADCFPLSADEETEHCAQAPGCGANPSGNPCGCQRTAADSCFCHGCVNCDNPAIIPCTSQADCPLGWGCAISCCSDIFNPPNDFTCLPSCLGDNPDPCVGLTGAAARRGRTSMG